MTWAKHGGHPAAKATVHRISTEGLRDPQAAVRHGVYATGFLACRRCPLRAVDGQPAACERYDQAGDCVLEQEYAADRRAELMAQPGVTTTDRFLVRRS